MKDSGRKLHTLHTSVVLTHLPSASPQTFFPSSPAHTLFFLGDSFERDKGEGEIKEALLPQTAFPASPLYTNTHRHLHCDDENTWSLNTVPLSLRRSGTNAVFRLRTQAQFKILFYLINLIDFCKYVPNIFRSDTNKLGHKKDWGSFGTFKNT